MPDIDEKFVHAIAELASQDPDVKFAEAFLPGANSLSFEGKRFFQITGKNTQIKDITADLLNTLPNPQHRSGTVRLTNLTSFEAFVWRMKEHSTVLFADQKKTTIEAVFDYHEALQEPQLAIEVSDGSAKQPVAEPLPRWGRFKARYAFPHHRSWTTWKEMNGKAMTQAQLAAWIEDNITDVLDVHGPDEVQSPGTKELIHQLGLKLGTRSKLIAAARGLQITVEERVGSVVNTSTGEVKVIYEEKHEADNGSNRTTTPTSVDVPNAFILALPVFEGGDAFELLVRLKYRKVSGTIQWHYDIFQLQRAEDIAFSASCEKASAATAVPLFYAALSD